MEKHVNILSFWSHDVFFPLFLKCPFHGKIIPRDECGVPINAEDRAREEKMRFEKQATQPGLCVHIYILHRIILFLVFAIG